MCGEHTLQFPPMCHASGSSPHVRGTLTTVPGALYTSGIIPACAGNTDYARARFGAAGDHPRMCGEHPCRACAPSVRPGSSPHVRGTRFRELAPSDGNGIIPACAGNTPVWPSSMRRARDHPRMCGEHRNPMRCLCRRRGSSPHVRGTLTDCTGQEIRNRIIPACAGNTSWMIMVITYLSGSSPHVRGTLC